MDGGTEGERIARLEGAYAHLATKADMERLQSQIEGLRSEVKAELKTIKWFIATGIAAAGVVVSVLDRLLI